MSRVMLRNVGPILSFVVLLMLIVATEAGAVTVEDIILRMNPGGVITKYTPAEGWLETAAYDPAWRHYNEDLARHVLHLPDKASLALVAGSGDSFRARSIEFRVNVPEDADRAQTDWMTLCASDHFTLRLLPSTGVVRLSVKNERGEQSVATQTVSDWQAGRWHHMAVTFSGTTARVFLDGSPVLSLNGFEAGRPINRLELGSHENHHKWLVGDLFLYRRPLSGGEVKSASLRVGRLTHGDGLTTRVVVPKIGEDDGLTKTNIPQIDGKVSFGEWSYNISRYTGFSSLITGELSSIQSRIHLGFDEHHLYVAYRSGLDMSAMASYGNAIEVETISLSILTPGGTKAVMTADQDGMAVLQVDGGPQIDAGNWLFKSLDRLKEGEIRIPFAMLGEQPGADSVWGVNFAVNYDRDRTLWSLAREIGDDRYAQCRLLADSHTVHLDSLGELINGVCHIRQEVICRRSASRVSRKVFSGTAPYHYDIDRFVCRVQSNEDSGLGSGSKSTTWLDRYAMAPYGPDHELRILEYRLDPEVHRIEASLNVSNDDPHDMEYYRLVLPFAFSASTIGADMLLFDQKAAVWLDPGSGIHPLNDFRVRFVIEPAAEGDPLVTGWLHPDESGYYEINVYDLPKGMSTLRAEISDIRGTILRRAETTFEKYDHITWEEAAVLGVSSDVPPPWEPIVADEGTLKVLGRDYEMGLLGLPRQLHCWGDEILAGPISLIVAAGENETPVTAKGLKLLHKSDGKVTYEVQGEVRSAGGAIVISGTVSLEYDGFLWYDLALSPTGDVPNYDRLVLKLPIREQYATHLQHNGGVIYTENYFLSRNWSDHVNMIELKEEQGLLWESDFKYHVWLGGGFNLDQGLSFLAENNHSWRNTEERKALQVVREGETVSLLVNLVDRPSGLTSEFRFSFGLQATPVKRIAPELAREWRLGTLEQGANMIGWFNALGTSGYTASNPEAAKEYIAQSRHAGLVVSPYQAGNISLLYPDILKHGYEWARIRPESAAYSRNISTHTRRYTLRNFQSEQSVDRELCPATPFADHLVWRAKYIVENYDPQMIYYDNASISGCKNLDHGCGYREEGRVIAQTNILAMRDIFKRIRTVMHQAGGEPPYLFAHCAFPVPAVHGFIDMQITGEQYNVNFTESLRNQGRQPDYYDHMDWPLMRNEFGQGPCGQIKIFLPNILGVEYLRGNVTNLEAATAGLLSIALLHDANIWNASADTTAISKTWRIAERFRIKEAEFVPYWHNNEITAAEKDVRISYYRRDGELLVVVANSSDGPKDIEVDFNVASLGIDGNTRTVDEYHDQEYRLRGGRLTISIAAKKFALLRVGL